MNEYAVLIHVIHDVTGIRFPEVDFAAPMRISILILDKEFTKKTWLSFIAVSQLWKRRQFPWTGITSFMHFIDCEMIHSSQLQMHKFILQYNWISL